MKELWNLVPAAILLGTVTLGCDMPLTQSHDRKKASDTLVGNTPKVPLKELAVDLGRGLKLGGERGQNYFPLDGGRFSG